MKYEYDNGPIYGSEKSSKKSSLAPLIPTMATKARTDFSAFVALQTHGCNDNNGRQAA
jgi:hypothetical protein